MRVLIAMSDTGGGHRSVARAVATGLTAVDGPACEASIVDLFEQGKRNVFDRFTRLYSPAIRRAPWLYGALYHWSDHPRRYSALYAPARRLTIERTSHVLAAHEPDAIVSAHPLCNRLLLGALGRLGRRVPVVAVVTELVSVHVSWCEPGLDLYTTATRETYEAVVGHGIPAERVRLLGLPVGLEFGRVPTPPAELRRRMGLAPDRFTVLVIGGGEGVGLGRIVTALAAAEFTGQLIVVCGRNEALRRQLAARSSPFPMAVFGFVDNVAELMHASDVVVTKGGPQTIAEAFASGRPVILTQELPGQEEGNASFVERRGAGYAAMTPRRVVAALRHLLENPTECQRLAANARALSRPDAAMETARAILGVTAPRAHVR
ncbi:MAG: glycosyltransferase [Chloroflexi bacterium]|nr:glycosyltransferase [Chloroflexota bacterium]